MRFLIRSTLIALTVLFAICVGNNAHAVTPTTSYTLTADGKGITPSPSMTLIQNFYGVLLDTMKEGPTLGFEGRYKKLEPTITQTFNLPAMARLAVGPTWTKATPDQQQAITKAFASFSIATYASRFKKFDGELFEVLGEKPMPNGGVMVETKLTPKGESSVILNYVVRNDESGLPRIMDVYLDASISELATRRADFTAVIKREGFDALIGSLEDKIKKMKNAQLG